MATLLEEQRKKQLKQLQDAQKQVDALSQIVNGRYTQAPAGQLAGANLNAAQMGGASGVGFETPENQAAISGATESAANAGVSKSNAGDGAVSVFNNERANYALRGAGLAGIIDPSSISGLKTSDGVRKIQEEKNKRLGQVTANTTFLYNPETISGTKKIVDRVGIGLNDISNDPWSSKGTQTDQIKATLDASARQIASLFGSQEEFDQAMVTNPMLQQTMESFTKLGGDVASISTNIQTPVNAGTQSTGDYLSTLTNPQANKEAEQKAIDELMPERQTIQAEIARQQQIPQEAINLYFGTEDQIGIIQMKKDQAIEEQKIIERKEKSDQVTLKAKAKLAIDKNNAEMRIQTAKIEENRLAAKNYMTGMLAKLGALNTTGAAPMALQTLDTKYQISAQTLENQYKYQEQGIKIELEDKLNGIETATDENILKLEQDLTKDYETITKEILKLQQASDKEVYELTLKYQTELRKKTTEYTADLQKEAEKYAKSFASIASNGVDLFSLSKTVNGTLERSSSKNAITSSITNVKNDIKKNLPPAIANKILTDLTDEQVRLFLEDFLNERVNSQTSFDPTEFYKTWKQANAPEKASTSTGDSELDDYIKKLESGNVL